MALDIDDTLSFTNLAWFQRLVQLFGNPTGLSTLELVEKYHLAQHVPFWQTAEAKEGMQRQRDSPEAQDNLPLIPGALEGVRALLEEAKTPIVAYITVRPSSVNPNTIRWL